MYFFLNNSFYVASILSETQLTVLKGCMKKVPKRILILYVLHRQTQVDMCKTQFLSQVMLLLLSFFFFFTSKPSKKQCVQVYRKLYPCECPRMLPDSIFWTTCHSHFYISQTPVLSECDFYSDNFPTHVSLICLSRVAA